jgi:hypothetical protein
MSQINGDKSRFNRVRKQRIQLRKRTREFLQAEGLKVDSTGARASGVAAATGAKNK